MSQVKYWSSITLQAIIGLMFVVLLWVGAVALSPAHAEQIKPLPPASSNGSCSGPVYWIEATGRKHEGELSATRPEPGCWIAVSKEKDKWCWVHDLPGVKQVYSGNSNCEAIGGGKCPSQEPTGRGCRATPLGPDNWHAYIP